MPPEFFSDSSFHFSIRCSSVSYSRSITMKKPHSLPEATLVSTEPAVTPCSVTILGCFNVAKKFASTAKSAAPSSKSRLHCTWRGLSNDMRLPKLARLPRRSLYSHRLTLCQQLLIRKVLSTQPSVQQRNGKSERTPSSRRALPPLTVQFLEESSTRSTFLPS